MRCFMLWHPTLLQSNLPDVQMWLDKPWVRGSFSRSNHYIRERGSRYCTSAPLVSEWVPFNCTLERVS